MTRWIPGWIAATPACLVLACAPGRPALPAAAAQAATGKPIAGHVVEGEALRAAMRKLDDLQEARLPQELDFTSERLLRSRRAVETGQQIAAVAERIPEIARLDELGEAERERFRQLAEALQVGATALAREADRLPRPEVERRFAELEETCEACHALFRRGR